MNLFGVQCVRYRRVVDSIFYRYVSEIEVHGPRAHSRDGDVRVFEGS